MKVRLEVMKGPEPGLSCEITKPDTCIMGWGGKRCLVHFELSYDPYMAQQHFILVLLSDKVFLKTLALSKQLL